MVSVHGMPKCHMTCERASFSTPEPIAPCLLLYPLLMNIPGTVLDRNIAFPLTFPVSFPIP